MKAVALLLLVAGCGGLDIAPGDGATLEIDAAETRDAASAPPDFAMALPAKCPCPLGSYCDLATNACKRGCLGNDHCPADQRCDTRVFACAPLCDPTTPSPCPNHLKCQYQAAAKICTGCVDDFGDCNRDPFDGCETSLDTLANCGECGKPATTQCYPDGDGDGYGVGPAMLRCRCGSRETSSTGKDCDDADWLAHPGQDQYFDRPRVGGGFDFNCDGKESPKYEAPVSNGCSCFGDPAWVWIDGAPACGTDGRYIVCDWDTVHDECDALGPITQRQLCR